VSFNTPPRVFISYARKDGKAFATALRRRLETEQPEITVWLTSSTWKSGKPLRTT
jgi:hypothetical protein